jgi:membrane protein DedA with SNARE-associated domain
LFSFHNLLLHHGYILLSVYVLVVSLGVPIPVDPVFLLMGAQAGDHHYSFFLSVMTALWPAVLGDILWYQIGKHKGRSVLKLLCKLSLEPDTCVRKTEGAFSARGSNALLFSKFIPGMGLASVTLAGISGMSFGRFVLADSAGCAVWATSYLGLGWLFHKQVDTIISSLGLYGRRAGLVIVILLALYLAYKYFQRWRFIRNLRVNRVTPEQVRELIASGCGVTIVDLRHQSEVERVGIKIPNAVILRPEDLRSRSHEIPLENEIILYCT